MHVFVGRCYKKKTKKKKNERIVEENVEGL
jgi:hypothetical protein